MFGSKFAGFVACFLLTVTRLAWVRGQLRSAQVGAALLEWGAATRRVVQGVVLSAWEFAAHRRNPCAGWRAAGGGGDRLCLPAWEGHP